MNIKLVSTYPLIIILSLIFASCNTNKSSFKMNNVYVEKLNALEASMISYMKEAEPSYVQDDVNKCVEILKEYLQKISESKSKVEGEEIVKSTVISMNRLNEKCDYGLIETGEREQIADIIISAAADKGYTTLEEDITEEWREW